MLLRPLYPHFGVEVSGVDLAGEPSGDIADRLRAAWHEHGLLLFRDQNLSEDDTKRTGAIFGTVSYEGDPPAYVSNVPEFVMGRTEAEAEYEFHMDFSFSERPLRGIMLYGIEVPPPGGGGETLFADVQLAYELLPGAVRERLRDLDIVHSTTVLKFNPTIKEHRTSIHPVAFRHPVTAKTVLYCSPRHFLRFEGLDERESAALCEELAGHIARPDTIYTHVWQPGDVVVWDNLRLQHARKTWDRAYRRHLRRTQIAAPAAVAQAG